MEPNANETQSRYISINSWQLDIDYRLLSSGEVKRELEPLIYELLMYFIKHNAQLVSRRELVDAIWGGRFVDDNTINRAIFELRKALKLPHDDVQYIKTFYKKGYSFLANIEHLTPSQSDTSETDEDMLEIAGGQASAPRLHADTAVMTTSKGVMHWVSLLVALGVISVVILFLASTLKTELIRPQLLQHETLFWEKGTVILPSVSFDKQWLAFSADQTGDGHFTLKLQKLGNLNVYSVNSDKSADAYAVGWATHSPVLYFQQLFHSQERSGDCELWSADFSEGIEQVHYQKLLDCDTSYLMSVGSVDPAHSIVYTKYHYRGEPGLSALVQRNLLTGTEFQITSPDASGKGDYFFHFSHSGTKLAFLREKEEKSQLFFANIDGSKQHKLLDINDFISRVEWSDSDQHITWFDALSGSLSQFSLANNELALQPMRTSHPLQSVIRGNHDSYIAVSKYRDFDVQRLQYTDREVKVAAYSDSMLDEKLVAPFYTKRGSIYLTEGHDGTTIWQKSQAGREKLFSTAPKQMKELLLSQDDRYLVMADNHTLYIYSLTELSLAFTLPVTGVLNSAVWHDQRVYFTTLSEGQSQSWYFDLADKQVVPFSSIPMQSILSIDHQHVLFLSPQRHLMQMNRAGGQPHLLKDFSQYSYLRWAISGEQVFMSDGSAVFSFPVKEPDSFKKVYQSDGGFILRLKASYPPNPEVFISTVQWRDNLMLRLYEQ
ncbi:winged helix-turn-helix domain-containing protein [Pseudoalteromonas sp. OOF1S-7]|uniref:winged helix-turn-helix domain-containing protein n=1 Tax=Pseudoalteromonas sp. OOF1S-7 TaxID=2917757 RepID=UPI001EF531E2|nr:winged helix-turn-helix domain-containing protein [Pseudoalteromonas sp. OOF1S-7]MCG7536149.1 winged helix-turn-helix domain-containing protein [Pseudoalteromonas sp. OOF1S-7]